MSLRDIALALFIIALWGMNLVVIRIGALEIPPLTFLTIRLALCSLMFMPFFKRLDGTQFKNLFFYAIPYITVHLGTLFIGLKFTPSALSGLILQLEIPFLVLIGWLFLGERFGLKTFIGILLAMIGVITIIYQPQGAEPIGYLGPLLLVTSALAWAVGSIRMKYIQDLDFATMTGGSHAIALPFIAALACLIEDNHWQNLLAANQLTFSFVMFYQVIVMSLCLYWWKGLMNRNPAYKVSIFIVLLPLFTVLFGILVLNETLSANAVIGGAIALAGVAIVTVRKSQKSAPLPEE